MKFKAKFCLTFLVLTWMATVTIGCGGVEGKPAVKASPPIDGELKKEIDEVLDLTFDRQLDLREHAAWQILHGALAFGRDFQVENNAKKVKAVDHILNGGLMDGWTTEPPVLLNPKARQYGLRAIVESGTGTGQGHPDQWFAVLSQCDLKATQKIKVANHTFTMSDYVHMVQHDVFRNGPQEYSWTLIGLTKYLKTDAKWKAGDGEMWSIERLLEIEVDQDEQERGEGACGGSHRLIGMAMSLNQHRANKGKIDGVWKRADTRIRHAIELAREYQNPDGTLSANYFERPGTTPNMKTVLGSTGHTVEFLALAMTDEELREPWVVSAVVSLCDIFRKTKDLSLECGALYHAAHGLALYRQRLFGKRSFP